MGSDLGPMLGWCLGPDQPLTSSGTGVRAGVKSGAQLRVRPRRDAGTAGVGAGLEPRAGAHWRCSHMAGGCDPSGLGPEPGTSGLDRGTGGRNWSLRLRQNPRRSQSRDRNRVGRRNRRRISGRAHSPELLVHGAESRRAGPSRRTRSTLKTRESGARHHASQSRPPRARAGGLPAATLLAQRPQPT